MVLYSMQSDELMSHGYVALVGHVTYRGPGAAIPSVRPQEPRSRRSGCGMWGRPRD